MFSQLVTAKIRPAQKEPASKAVGSDSQGRIFVPKDLVEREYSSLFSRGRQKKRELLLVSTHTENFCTSYHGNIHLEERNRPLGTSILKPFKREMPRSTSQMTTDHRR